jgi:hypothetical protein
VLSTELNHKLGPWGAVKLVGEYQWIEDVVDRVPINANGQPVQNPIQNLGQITGQGVGNVDKAWAASITASGTINLDQIGAKGLQLEFNYRYRDSELDDPLTAFASLRWDVPDTPWTLVAGVEEFQNYANYRLDQISRGWQSPTLVFASIENKDVFGMKVRVQVANLNDSSENFKREVYQGGLRTNPIDFVEERYRTFGPIARLNVSGTF